MAGRIIPSWMRNVRMNEEIIETRSGADAAADIRHQDRNIDGRAQPRLRQLENTIRSSLYKAYAKANGKVRPNSAAGMRRHADIESKRAWTAWAQEAHLPYEQRDTALERLRAWRRAVPRPSLIDLSNLGLKTAPPNLPEGVVINVDGNPLSTLNAWRDWASVSGLSETEAAGRHNALQALNQWYDADPRPDVLDLNALGLRSLPADFPPVGRLILASNDLEAMPELPATLRALDISQNRRLTTIGSLPANLEQLHAALSPIERLQQLPDTLAELDLNMHDDQPRLALDLSALPRGLRVLKLSNRVLNEELLRSVARCESLQHLNLAGNGLAELPLVPAGILILDIAANNLKRLPGLPPALVNLNARNNELGQLELTDAAFPMLEDLDASENALRNLPNIPSTIRRLNVRQNMLTRLPDLPDGLEVLAASGNRLSQLPGLPRQLRVLEIASNEIRNLPELPDTLIRLDASNNELDKIMAPLRQIEELNVRRNQLEWLPRIPPSLRKLDASDNNLHDLPPLPRELHELNVSLNGLRQIPELPADLRVLNISDNLLETLPSLPEGLIELDARNTSITQLNGPLPSGLRICDISLNNFTELPPIPDTVHTLIVNRNNLSGLPRLPDGLLHLEARSNRLVSLENLPDTLRVIDLSRNSLASLPRFNGRPTLLDLQRNLFDTLTLDMDSYGPDCHVNVRGNLFTVHTQDRLILISLMHEDESANLPRITYDLPAPALLRRQIANWYPDDQTRLRAMAHWHDVPDDGSFEAFSGFLERLSETTHFSNAILLADITQWLDRLAMDQELRNSTMVLSAEALGHCDDRITLSFNHMKMLDLAAQINSGAYDERLPEVIALARGWYRMERLELFARRKIEEQTAAHEAWQGDEAATPRPPLPDDVEVYLALQVRLRRLLALPIDDAGMLFENIAALSEEDYTAAAREVIASERDGFVRYLALQWSPWLELLKRLDPENYENAQERIVDQLSSDQYHQSINARLASFEIEEPGGERDIEIQLGRVISDEIREREIVDLTRHLLESRGLVDLLDRPALPDINDATAIPENPHAAHDGQANQPEAQGHPQYPRHP